MPYGKRLVGELRNRRRRYEDMTSRAPRRTRATSVIAIARLSGRTITMMPLVIGALHVAGLRVVEREPCLPSHSTPAEPTVSEPRCLLELVDGDRVSSAGRHHRLRRGRQYRDLGSSVLSR